jgi:phosphatidylethanolamine N-methyltransferase
MRKLYGDSLRKDAGFVKVMKKVASNNARMLESRAGRHAPAIKSVAREVKGTFDKVYEETAEAVEDFLSKCECPCPLDPSGSPMSPWWTHPLTRLLAARPRISGVVQDTKFLLQQSRERLVITRVANNVGALETSKYKMTVVPTGQSEKSGLPLRFHLGEPIKVNWTAPTAHSRRDWIGLYRVCQMRL